MKEFSEVEHSRGNMVTFVLGSPAHESSTRDNSQWAFTLPTQVLYTYSYVDAVAAAASQRS